VRAVSFQRKFFIACGGARVTRGVRLAFDRAKRRFRKALSGLLMATRVHCKWSRPRLALELSLQVGHGEVVDVFAFNLQILIDICFRHADAHAATDIFRSF